MPSAQAVKQHHRMFASAVRRRLLSPASTAAYRGADGWMHLARQVSKAQCAHCRPGVALHTHTDG